MNNTVTESYKLLFKVLELIGIALLFVFLHLICLSGQETAMRCALATDAVAVLLWAGLMRVLASGTRPLRPVRVPDDPAIPGGVMACAVMPPFYIFSLTPHLGTAGEAALLGVALILGSLGVARLLYGDTPLNQ